MAVGTDHNVGAQEYSIGSLSADADQQILLVWYDSFTGHPPVRLVHWEVESIESSLGTLRRNTAVV